MKKRRATTARTHEARWRVTKGRVRSRRSRRWANRASAAGIVTAGHGGRHAPRRPESYPAGASSSLRRSYQHVKDSLRLLLSAQTALPKLTLKPADAQRKEARADKDQTGEVLPQRYQ